MLIPPASRTADRNLSVRQRLQLINTQTAPTSVPVSPVPVKACRSGDTHRVHRPCVSGGWRSIAEPAPEWLTQYSAVTHHLISPNAWTEGSSQFRVTATNRVTTVTTAQTTAAVLPAAPMTSAMKYVVPPRTAQLA